MLEIDWQSPHLWRKTAGPQALDAPPLVGETTADLCVIGAGLTGISTALHAAEAGARVALLEGREVGSAASGRNTGQVIAQHSKAVPSEIEAELGPVRGARYNELVARSAADAFELMRRHGIDAHQVQGGWIQPAHTDATLARARRAFEEWQAFGAQVEWLEAAEVLARVGSHYLGGWRVVRSGHINPYAFTRGLARAAQAAGVALHEYSLVERIERAGAEWHVVCAQGRVRARQVVVATNALTGRFWPKLARAMIPMKVFDTATAPLSEALRARVLRANPAVSDMRRDLRYFHLDRDFRIVTGGTHTLWHDARARGIARTRRMLAATFPALAADMPEITEYWEGVFAMVPDRKPRLMRLADGILFGGLYSGRGVALSVSLGREMARWATGLIDEDALPLPVTSLRLVPAQPVAARVANAVHPLLRAMDRRDEARQKCR